MLQIHPRLAANLGVVEGEQLLVESRRGSVSFRVRISADIRPDTLFAPFHWGGRQAANLLTIPALDPLSRMPEFKVCAVRARAATSYQRDCRDIRKKKLAIVGNGMGTCRLLDELVRRDGTRQYEITVFGEERGGAYNRILLGKVLSGESPDANRHQDA